jgi:hypothetical protein
MTPKFSRSLFVVDEKLSSYLENDEPVSEREHFTHWFLGTFEHLP